MQADDESSSMLGLPKWSLAQTLTLLLCHCWSLNICNSLTKRPLKGIDMLCLALLEKVLKTQEDVFSNVSRSFWNPRKDITVEASLTTRGASGGAKVSPTPPLTTPSGRRRRGEVFKKQKQEDWWLKSSKVLDLGILYGKSRQKNQLGSATRFSPAHWGACARWLEQLNLRPSSMMACRNAGNFPVCQLPRHLWKIWKGQGKMSVGRYHYTKPGFALWWFVNGYVWPFFRAFWWFWKAVSSCRELTRSSSSPEQVKKQKNKLEKTKQTKNKANKDTKNTRKQQRY